MKRFNEDEIKIVRDRYSNLTKEEILKLLPHRSYDTIKQIAHRYNCFKPSKKWTEDENNVLKEHYSKSSKDIITKLLPKRTWNSIHAQAEKKLFLSRPLVIHSASNLKEVKMKEWQLGYVAGLIDGEGSFVVIPHTERNAFGFEITIANTNKAALEEIQRFVGFGKVYQDAKSPAGEYYLTRKMGYKYRIFKISEVLPLTSKIKDYLFIKRKHAEIFEKMMREIITKKLEHGKRNGYVHSKLTWDLFYELKALNMRGITDEEREDRQMKMEEFKLSKGDTKLGRD